MTAPNEPDPVEKVLPERRVRCHGCAALHPASFIVLDRGLGRNLRRYCGSCAEIVKEQGRRPGVALALYQPAAAENLRIGAPASWLVLVCPFCGGRHSHGAGGSDDDPAAFLGWHVAHCVDGKGRAYALAKLCVDPLPPTNRGRALASGGGA